jgi:hypothetical protein
LVPDSDDLAPAPTPARGHRVGPEPSRGGMAHPPAGLADEFGHGAQPHAKQGAQSSVEPIVVHLRIRAAQLPGAGEPEKGTASPRRRLCQWRAQRLSRSWTWDQIVAAIQAWAERTGEPPTSNGWRKSTSSPTETTDRTPAPNDHPTTGRVTRVFGSWSEAIEAAGFTPRPQGNQPGTKRGQRKVRKRAANAAQAGRAESTPGL